MIIVLVIGWRNYWYLYNKTFDSVEMSPTENLMKIQLDDEYLIFGFNESHQIYTLDEKPIIWMYWENFTEIPPYIRLSIELIKCHNHAEISVQILNRTTVHNFLENIHMAFYYLNKQHQSDYVRCRLLKKYGGMWIDPDTIQLTTVVPLFELLHTYDVVGSWWPRKY